ncbi:hypothetical protein TRFO_08426 [Tritrichomonas foetus]|uniref:Uncharacterized protein n=1 Tax=Tritrichomonas foetus TaxID=1144522 RepID=A0A1J4JPN6_9EUKA|nr:hypothetical protein TRFO_08426 [Tritrichomonas foetus]|eukprot:OHS99475.1 hypothetical protein TRFO_08426 [Tritrichomonas foetus]
MWETLIKILLEEGINSLDISNLCIYIIIGDKPSKIKNKINYVNYALFSNAQLIQKIMENLFNVNPDNIMIFASGEEQDYENLLKKTHEKIFTQINKEEVLFQIPSDISNYMYFNNLKILISNLRDASIQHENMNAFLFILDNGSEGYMNEIHYTKIYQAMLRGTPKSLRIFNDCCHGGSIISSIQHYFQFYQKLINIKELFIEKDNHINVGFLSYYLLIARSINNDLFFDKIQWLTNYFSNIDIKQLSFIQNMLDIMIDKIQFQNLKLENSNISIIKYINDRLGKKLNKNTHVSLNKGHLQTSGELIISVAALYCIDQFPESLQISQIQSIINPKNTNIFLQLCGKNPIVGVQFLQNLSEINFSYIYPPVPDLRMFASSSIYSSFSSVRISPQMKIYVGSPRISEEICEILFRNTGKYIDFQRIKNNMIVAKGVFKEYPVQSPVKTDVIKKIVAMKGIKDLAYSELQDFIIKLAHTKNYHIQEAQKFTDYNTKDELNNPKQELNITNEEWNNQTSITRIAENEIRTISAISMISALSTMLPIDAALEIITTTLSKEQAVIVIITRILCEESYEAGLFSMNILFELLKTADEVLDQNGINPSAASRMFIINESNVFRLLIFSFITFIINSNCKNIFETLINKFIDEKIRKYADFIIQAFDEIDVKKILNNKYNHVHQLHIQELLTATILLKQKIQVTAEIMNNYIQQFAESQKVSCQKEKQVKINEVEIEEKIRKKIHKNAGSYKFVEEAILLAILNSSSLNGSIPSEKEVDEISNNILNLRNEIVQEINKIIVEKNDSSLYEVIALNITKCYSNNKMNRSIAKIVAYKLREMALDLIFFPRNPKDINFINSLFPSDKNKMINLLIHSLTEISKLIITPFKIYDEEFEVVDGNEEVYDSQNEINQKIQERNSTNNNNYQEYLKDEDIESQKEYLENDEFNDNLKEEFITKISHQKEGKIEEEQYKIIINNLKHSHSYIGISAAIEIISSYYLNNNPITFPILHTINNITQEIPEEINITITMNDILQLVGFGSFGMEKTGKRKRCRKSRKESQDFDYSQENKTQIKFPVIVDEDYSDEGIFQEEIKDTQNPQQSEKVTERHISDEEIKKLQTEILGESKESYEDEIWIIFKKQFTERIKNITDDKINLEFPINLGIGESLEYKRSLEKVFHIIPLTDINYFWTFKRNIAEFASLHDEELIIQFMIQSFDDADRVVTPRHYKGKKRYNDTFLIPY